MPDATDHKYDPVSQKEFYQLFAYFNNVPEHGKAIKYGNSPPYIKSPTRAARARLEAASIAAHAAEALFTGLEKEIDHQLASWARQLPAEPEIPGT